MSLWITGVVETCVMSYLFFEGTSCEMGGAQSNEEAVGVVY